MVADRTIEMSENLEELLWKHHQTIMNGCLSLIVKAGRKTVMNRYLR
jgi:hypothetical protein